eukprot:280292-Pleurochrysis_carterae.AAC.2
MHAAHTRVVEGDFVADARNRSLDGHTHDAPYRWQDCARAGRVVRRAALGLFRRPLRSSSACGALLAVLAVLACWLRCLALGRDRITQRQLQRSRDAVLLGRQLKYPRMHSLPIFEMILHRRPVWRVVAHVM